jgi:DNA-binding NarL/FixJ family response regulator
MRRCSHAQAPITLGLSLVGSGRLLGDDRGVNDRLKVVVADDAVLLRDGLASLLERAGMTITGRAGDSTELMRRVELTQPDVAVIDIKMPPTHTDEGLVAAERIRAEHPATGVLVLSQYLDVRYAMRLLEQYPTRVGYLLKERVSDSGVVVDAVRRVAAGECIVDPTIVSRLLRPTATRPALGDLTERERAVLALVAEGLSNKGIGERLHISPKTVEANIHQIFMKLDLHDDPGEHRRVLAVLAYLRA